MSVRFGVSLPKDLAEEVDELAKVFGYKTRSALIADAVKHFTSYLRLAEKSRVVRGVVVVVLRKEKCEEVIKRVNREFLAKMYNDIGMIIFFYEGKTEELRGLMEELRELRGVLLVLPTLLPTREKKVEGESERDEGKGANQ